MKRFFTLLPIFLALLSSGISVSAQSRFTPEVDARAKSILAQMTDEEKLIYIGGEGMYTKAIERLGIPRVKMSDGPQGVGTHGQSTAYPCALMLTASWNPDLAYRYGQSLARDCRAREVDILLGPGVNIYRAPMCGRNFEYMGEDPWLASRMAVEYIRGVQDQGVMAMVKHFAANNSEYDRKYVSADVGERALNEIYFPAFRAAVQAGVGSVMSSYNLLNNVWTAEDPWLLQEVLRAQWGFKGMVVSDWESTHNALPTLRHGVDLEMPWCMVTSPEVARELLRAGEITWADIDRKVFNLLRTFIAFGFFDPKPASATALPIDDPASRATALEVAREGAVLLKNEDAVLPIRRKEVRKLAVVGGNARRFVAGGGSGGVVPFAYTDLWSGIGQMADKYKIEAQYLCLHDYMPKVVFTGAGSSELGFRAEYFDNQELVGEPKVVRIERDLKFDWSTAMDVEGISRDRFSARWSGVLRPATSGEYLFVLGADDGYRLYVDGKLVIDNWTSHIFNAMSYRCPLEVGREYEVRIEYFQNTGGAGLDFAYCAVENNAFVEALDKADLVIANIGFNAGSETEGADRTFDLPAEEQALLDLVLRTKTPVVGVVNAGGGVHLTAQVPQMKGLLWGWYAGQEGGRALAEILFGEVSPSGKLPITLEKEWADNPTFNSYYTAPSPRRVNYSEGIFVGYRGYDKLKREVLYPFGYGLTYSTFEVSDVKASPSTADDALVEVEYLLRNTGRRTAAEVVQIYVGKRGESIVERPEKELKCYRKISLKPGESRRVTEKLDRSAFSYYSIDDKDFVLDKGDYRILLGFSSRDIAAEAQVAVDEN